MSAREKRQRGGEEEETEDENNAKNSKKDEEQRPSPLDPAAIRILAEDKLGYRAWYECDRYNTVMAYDKTMADDFVRVQVYPLTHVVNVLVVQGGFEEEDAENSREGGGTSPTNPQLPADLRCQNPKKLYVVGNVDRIETLEEIMQDPSAYGRRKQSLVYTRRDNVVDLWTPPPAPPAECAQCHAANAPRFCTRCRSVWYCNVSCQKAHWKEQHKRTCREHQSSEWDVARRWNHIALASGAVPSSSTEKEEEGGGVDEVQALVECAQFFETLLFEPRTPPCLEYGRYECGSLCSLSNLLLEVGREHHNVVGFCRIQTALDKFRGDNSEDIDYYAHFPPCGNADAFGDQFHSLLGPLRDEIVALPPHLRVEFIQFEFERIRCREGLCMINSEEIPLFTRKTFAIHFANMDYSRLVYGDDAERRMCFMHGTVYPTCHCHDHDHGDEEDSVNRDGDGSGDDEGTEATAASEDELVADNDEQDDFGEDS